MSKLDIRILFWLWLFACVFCIIANIIYGNVEAIVGFVVASMALIVLLIETS